MSDDASPRRFPWWILFVVAMLLFMLKLSSDFSPPLQRFLGKFTHLFPADVSGSVTASGGLGDWTMHVDECQSGQSRQYFGVAFFDHAQPNLGGHVALPEDGTPRLLVNTPGKGGSEAIESSACSVWDVDIQNTTTSYNSIRAVTGHARFDCQYDNPDSHITGDLQFRSCH